VRFFCLPRRGIPNVRNGYGVSIQELGSVDDEDFGGGGGGGWGARVVSGLLPPSSSRDISFEALPHRYGLFSSIESPPNQD